MNKIKLTFIADNKVTPETLHSLYTSIRFIDNKKDNVEEEFRVWNENKVIFIIMNKDNIKNESKHFTFKLKDKNIINIKLIKKTELENIYIKNGDFVDLFGIISYCQKHYNVDNTYKSYCVLDTKNKFKHKTKMKFLEYLNRKTGLDFISANKNNQTIFDRVIFDENKIFNKKIEQKVLFRNIISINGINLEVIDSEKVKQLQFSSLGKKKSYGFGNFFISKS